MCRLQNYKKVYHKIFTATDGSLVSWKSIAYSIGNLSSALTEYITLPTTVKGLTWLLRLPWEVKLQQPFGEQMMVPTTTIFTVNRATIAISNHQLGGLISLLRLCCLLSNVVELELDVLRSCVHPLKG